MNVELVKKKWKAHRANAVNRKKVKALSFAEYMQKIIDANIQPEQIGATNNSYQLARYSDLGDYTLETCRFITKQENFLEQIKNGGIAAGAEKKRGRTSESHKGLAIMAEKRSKIFAFMSPQGEIHFGKNLYRFCLANGLNQGNMAEVRNGMKKACKGWIQAL